MAEQDLNYYIERLELLRELERKDLIRSEVVLKHQDQIVTEMLSIAPSKAISEHLERVSNLSLDSVISSSLQNDVFISYSHKDKKCVESQ